MTIYVETFRNIPLLLWIIVIFVVTSEIAPEPKDFKVTADMLTNRALLEGVEAVARASLWSRVISLDVASLPFVIWLLSGAGLAFAAYQFVHARLSAATRRLAPVAAALPVVLWMVLAVTSWNHALSRPLDIDPALAAAQTHPAATKILFGTVGLTNRGTYAPAIKFSHGFGYATVETLGSDGARHQVRRLTMFDDVPKKVREDDGTVQGKMVLVPAPGPTLVLAEGEVVTSAFRLSVLAVMATIIASVVLTIFVRRRASRIQEDTGVRPTTWWQIILILFAPTIALLWAMGLTLEIPAFATNDAGVSTGFNFQGGFLIQHSFTALLIALSLYTGAFIAEIVRAGILAISRGQTEAAFALGLRPRRTTNLVILPQALRVIIPPLISQYLNLTKNTSLGIAVSYLDIKGTLGGITLNQTGRELECMLLMMLIYLIISLIISSVMNYFNSSVKLKER